MRRLARLGRCTAMVLLVLALVAPLHLAGPDRSMAEVLVADTAPDTSNQTQSNVPGCDITVEGTPEPGAETLDPGAASEVSEPNMDEGAATPSPDCVGDSGESGVAQDDGSSAEGTIEPAGVEDGGEATPEPEQATEPPADVPSDVSGESEAPASTDDAGPDLGAVETAEEGTPTEEAVTIVSIPVTVFICSADPGPVDPATSGVCSGADGVEIAYTVDDAPATPVNTSGGGFASLEVPEGSAVFVEETVPAGYLPIGDGTAWIASAADGNAVTFVNVVETVLGRLQIVNGSCPTSGETRTEFRVIGPHAISAAATPVCSPTARAVFTITGGTLPVGGIQAITDDNGVWRGYLAAGDYTVIDDSGASDEATVEADELTAVIVIDYFRPPTGVLVVQRWVCTEGEEERTDIIVDGDASGPGCGLADGQMSLSTISEASAASSITFSLGPDGEATMTLPPGTYLLTDLSSSASAQVSVAAGRTTRASVRTISLYGTLVVRHFWCADPASNDEDASDPAYWEAECDAAGGVTVTLYDAGGTPVRTQATSGGGIITWSGVNPGTYTVDTENGICAAFVDGVDARGGFGIAAGSTTIVKIYSCAPPQDTGGGTGGDGTGGSGDNNGGNTGSDNNGGNNGGDGTQGPPDANTGENDGSDTGAEADEVSNVTTLPSTGQGSLHAPDVPWFALVAGIAACGAAALTARKRASRGLRIPR